MNRCCPICFSKDKNKIYDIYFDFGPEYYLPSHNQLVCCEKCGFIFADNDSTQKDYDLYYSRNDSYAFSDDIKYSNNDGPYVNLYMSTILEYIGNDDSLVDVGCGDGSLLYKIKEMGYEKLTGIDTSSVTIDMLNHRGIKGIVSSVFEIDKHISERFSLVVSTGVAEHIYDLDNYILNLKNLMKDNGKIIIIVPAIEGFSKKFTSFPNYFNHEHINYFSAVSLDNLMGYHGLVNTSDERYIVDVNGEYLLVGVYIKDINNDFSFEKDIYSKISVERYLKDYSEKKQNKESIIRSICKKDYILWGTGSLAIQLFAEYPNLKNNIKLCVDNNPAKWGTEFTGKTINKPEILIDSNNDMPILICSMLNAKEIIDQINDMKINNKYYVYD